MAKVKDKDRILKGAREKQWVICKGTPISADISAEYLQARREWHDIFKSAERENLQPRILYPARLSFRIEGEIRNFSDKKESSRNPMDTIHWGPRNRNSVTTPFWREAQWNMFCKPGCLCLLGHRLDPGPDQGQDKTRLSATVVTEQPQAPPPPQQHWCRQFWEALQNFPPPFNALPICSPHPPTTGNILHLSAWSELFSLRTGPREPGKSQGGSCTSLKCLSWGRWFQHSGWPKTPLPAKATGRRAEGSRSGGIPTSTERAWPALGGEPNQTPPEAFLQPEENGFQVPEGARGASSRGQSLPLVLEDKSRRSWFWRRCQRKGATAAQPVILSCDVCRLLQKASQFIYMEREWESTRGKMLTLCG